MAIPTPIGPEAAVAPKASLRLGLVFVHHLGKGRTAVYLEVDGERKLLGSLGYLGHSPEASRVFYLLTNLLETLEVLPQGASLEFLEEYG